MKLVLPVAGLLLDLILQFWMRKIGYGTPNSGVSFGFLGGFGYLVAVVAFILFVVYVANVNGIKERFSIWLLLAGGFGNILPRIFFRVVWDYIKIPIFPFWFNISDILICLGVASYILGLDGNRNNLPR